MLDKCASLWYTAPATSNYNIENECENEYFAQFTRASYTPLDMYCRPDGKEVDADDDLCKDFHFPDLANFLENIEQMTGVCPEALEVELIEGERGMVCISYRSNGEGVYEKDEPTCLWHVYYRISAPASSDSLECLLDEQNCSGLGLSVEHIMLTAVPLDGEDASPELLDNDLSEFDLDEVYDLHDLKIRAGGDYLERESRSRSAGNNAAGLQRRLWRLCHGKQRHAPLLHVPAYHGSVGHGGTGAAFPSGRLNRGTARGRLRACL